MLTNSLRRVAANGLSASIFLTLVIGSAAAHEGAHGNEEMWRVCEGKQFDNSCSFQNRSGDISRGSCQSMANHLVCVRNQPIERSSFADQMPKSYEKSEPERADGKCSSLGWVIASLAGLVGATILAVRFGKRQHRK